MWRKATFRPPPEAPPLPVPAAALPRSDHGHTSPPTRAAVLGPGPGSVGPSLGAMVAFLTADLAHPRPPARHAPSPTAPVHCLVAVSAGQQAALWDRWPRLRDACPDTLRPTPIAYGFHRVDLGECLLTLCVGPVVPSVAQWCGNAQHLWVGGDWVADPALLAELARPLARQSTLGASLTLDLPPPEQALPAWAQAGFLATANPQHRCYRPRWPVPPPHAPATRSALVVGAGLAGAAVCASLTRRGWHVTVLDGASGPAQAASSLPVGLLSEHLTAQDTVLSRLSRSGMALQWRELQRLVPPGEGWQATQVSHLRANDDGGTDPQPPLPHAVAPTPAAMVRPATLVRAWLAQAQDTGLLHARWGSPVARLRCVEDAQGSPTWQALDTHGGVLAQAAHVVLAAAFGSAALWPRVPDSENTGDLLRPVKGQLSFGPLTDASLAPHPVRDHGVYVPCFEDSTHPQISRLWAMGSTYERGVNNTTVTSQGHERNAASLAPTLPTAHAVFERQRAQGELMGWAQVRCASPDRLPLVGAVPAEGPWRANMRLPDVPRETGLWTFCALGSRGLTLSTLCAELLAAQMSGEPWPLEKDLGLALDPGRFALKRARKSKK